MVLPDRLSSALAPRYELQRELGRGGVATVYLARDLQSDVEVAIKVLDSEVASALNPARFAREIRIAARLRHPNVLPLLDSGDAAGFLYYVMPYADGGSLRDALNRERQLPADRTLRIATEIAAGIDHAHRDGVVHRDVKPENILFIDGVAAIADFGIARMLEGPDGDRLTTTRHMVGTPAYTSPEQLDPKRPIDGRTDVYALACVIHEMLAGEPPFTGPNAQVVVARHLAAQPPSLDVVRSSLPRPLVESVKRALSKSPADRFATAGELIEAMQAPESIVPRRRGVRKLAVAVGAAVVLVALALRFWPGVAGSELERSKVLVLPLATTVEPVDPLAGWDVALAVGGALEHAEPLKFIDAWPSLDPESRRDPSTIGTDAAATLSRQHDAAHFISGVIRGTGDSLAVVLRLHSVEGDSIVAQVTEAGPASVAAPHTLGMAAMRRILPGLVEPGRTIDVSPLTERAPAAIALWLQGERAYRQARFGEASDFYARAVAEDSLHALAALKGAQAASWTSRLDEAARLIGMAVRNDTLLPEKHRRLAAGLSAYFDGRSADAISALQGALALDSAWAEASMALGDVYYHLLPSDAHEPDSIARHWFEEAWGADTLFTPPLFHLAELGLRRGDLLTAGSHIDRWRRFDPDTILLRQVEFSLECLRRGPDDFDWSERVELHLRSVVQAGMTLDGGSAQLSCAQGAFRAVLDRAPASSPRSVRWEALKGLHGIAMAQGRYQEADSLLDVAVDGDLSVAQTLWIYATFAGGPFAEQADSTERRLREATDDLYREVDSFPHWRWLMGAWLARTGELERAESLVADMARHADAVDDRQERLLARALSAHLALARGDTAQALGILDDLAPDGPPNRIAFGEAEALGPERVLLAELLLVRGRYEEAYRAAGLLQHLVPSIYLQFLPKSLVVRLRAAEGMNRPDLARGAEQRLESLGWTQEEWMTLSPR